MQNTLQIHTFSDFSDQKLLSDWHSLWLSVPQAQVFLHPGYQKAWWECEGQGDLRILAIYEADALVGLAPLFRAPDAAEWQIVGAVDLSDYLDFLVLPDQVENVSGSLLEHWQTEMQLPLRLECLREDSFCLTHLSPVLAEKQLDFTKTQSEVCPTIALPSTWPEFLANLPATSAKNFSRLLREIGEEDEISYRLLDSAEAIMSAMPVFVELHQKSGPEKKAFWSPSRERFFTQIASELAPDHLIKLLFLDVNGTPAAALVFFELRGEYQIYNSGFDAYSFGYLGVGNAIILHSIKLAIESKHLAYDFLRGNEGYKYLFGAVDKPLYNLRIPSLS